MLRLLLGVCTISMALTGTAHAANCANHPYTLANGTIADAGQVMSDLDNLLSCGNNVLSPLANPNFTGSIGVNTTSPQSTLDVRGNVRIGNSSVDVFGFFYTDVPSGTFSIEAANGANTTKKNLGLVMFGGNVGVATATPSLKLTVNGTAGGTSAWQTVSDARLKTNVQPVSNALDLVGRLNPVRFDWRKPTERDVGKGLQLAVGEPQIGFIAQEVEQVVPEAVARPAQGSDIPYGLKEDNLIPVLVQAIKEQQSEIKALQDQVAALKARQ